MNAIGLLPSSEPRATSAIPDIRGFIGMVLDRGHAYEAGGGVYFDVSSFPDFGLVSNYSRDEMLAFAKERWRQHRRPPQARPSRLRAVAAVARRRAVVGVAVGPGSAGLAHRVLRARACASSAPPSTCTVAGPTRSSRTTSASGPSPRPPPASPSSATGCTRRWCGWTARRCRKLGNLVFVSELRKLWDPMVIRLVLLEEHYRTSWEWDDSA